eukprot:m.467328 g.467328  ORF g.467328 m.467328 type:complete len:391 (+) comp26232_c0_seq1:100-1272(+)
MGRGGHCPQLSLYGRVRHRLPLLLASLVVGSSIVSSEILHRVEVVGSCLDGSKYSVYVSRGDEDTRFHFYHEGGSWCFSQEQCAERASDTTANSLGSSLGWPASRNMTDNFARDPEINPLMHNWTFVYLPYCDGGSFAGDALGTWENRSLHYRGLRNRDATIAALRHNFNFDAATDVVVGGGSAGGIACYLHIDYYAEQARGARTVGMCDSGFFEDGDNDRDGKGDYDANMKALYGFMNATAGIHSVECTSALGYKCMFAVHLFPYIRHDFFGLNSAYDATMGNGECGAGSGITLDWNNSATVNACGNHVRAQFHQLLNGTNNAVFLDSCKHHCGEWNAITIEGLVCSEAVNAWYYGGVKSLPKGDGVMDAGRPYPCPDGTPGCCPAKFP